MRVRWPLRSTLGLMPFGVVRMVTASTVLRVSGPCGPAPAMKAAAGALVQTLPGVTLEVTAGPTPQWLDDTARRQHAVDYCGSEAIMAAIPVGLGNLDHATGSLSLPRPGMKVMEVDGVAQVEPREGIAGRNGSTTVLRAFCRDMVYATLNTAQSLRQWRRDSTLHAWFAVSNWASAHPHVAEIVALEPRYRIWRDRAVRSTVRGLAKGAVRAFVAFLEGKEGRANFRYWGWETGQGRTT